MAELITDKEKYEQILEENTWICRCAFCSSVGLVESKNGELVPFREKTKDGKVARDYLKANECPACTCPAILIEGKPDETKDQHAQDHKDYPGQIIGFYPSRTVDRSSCVWHDTKRTWKGEKTNTW